MRERGREREPRGRKCDIKKGQERYRENVVKSTRSVYISAGIRASLRNRKVVVEVEVDGRYVVIRG